MAEWIEGRLERVLWSSQESGWAVTVVRTTDGMPTTVVGPLADLAGVGDDGVFLTLQGEWVKHPTHGHQFKAEGYLEGSPQTLRGLELYLASSAIPGIGKSTAKRIVAQFGEDTFAAMSDPEQLQQLRGIGKAKADAIAHAWDEASANRGLGVLLQSAGLSVRWANRLAEQFGERAEQIVRSEPYSLSEKVRGIGFLTADRIARAVGVPEDAPQRVQAALVYCLGRKVDEGHCLVQLSELVGALQRLQVPTDGLQEAVDHLVAEGRVVQDEYEGAPHLTTVALDRAEHLVASSLLYRADSHEGLKASLDVVQAAERYVGLELDETQRQAVLGALQSGASVITGGPGTGKTTLVKVLIRSALEMGENWLLASPTGRAARRLSEATGQPASTLHRLLEFQPGGFRFGRDATNPLDCDGLVVDEASMVDVRLMASVLAALPVDRPCRLVLVGDADQLPSVGPGQVLRDIIRSGHIPVHALTRIHRQAAQSGIVMGAREVHEGRMPSSGQQTGHDDFFLIPRPDGRASQQTLVKVVTERLVAKGFDPRTDVQVLAPMRKGVLGTKELNEALQRALNGQGVAIKGRSGFREGDRVICTRNRYDFEVFNGDVGRVIRDGKDGLQVRFDDRDVDWPHEELDQLELAYALTIHKSQGSEYPAVVMVMDRSHHMMLRRNLLYTGLTRAKRFFCLIGDPQAWQQAVGRKGGDDRRTRLASMIRSFASETAEDDLEQVADPG